MKPKRSASADRQISPPPEEIRWRRRNRRYRWGNRRAGLLWFVASLPIALLDLWLLSLDFNAGTVIGWAAMIAGVIGIRLSVVHGGCAGVFYGLVCLAVIWLGFKLSLSDQWLFDFILLASISGILNGVWMVVTGHHGLGTDLPESHPGPRPGREEPSRIEKVAQPRPRIFKYVDAIVDGLRAGSGPGGHR